jgi:hypothetical protein
MNRKDRQCNRKTDVHKLHRKLKIEQPKPTQTTQTTEEGELMFSERVHVPRRYPSWLSCYKPNEQ